MMTRREFNPGSAAAVFAAAAGGMAKRGMPEGQLEKIFGTNLYRLYESVIG